MRTAIFPARGGSQRIPRKNIRDFKGKPMLQWPVEAAKASALFTHFVVSTDDQEITALARRLDCEVHMREADDGTTGTQEVAGRVLDWMGASRGPDDYACVIYPCSPMLTAWDLRDAWRFASCPVDRRYLVSSTPQLLDIGCFYWGTVDGFRDRWPLEGNACWFRMDPARFIDINTPDDWSKAESMFNALHP